MSASSWILTISEGLQIKRRSLCRLERGHLTGPALSFPCKKKPRRASERGRGFRVLARTRVTGNPVRLRHRGLFLPSTDRLSIRTSKDGEKRGPPRRSPAGCRASLRCRRVFGAGWVEMTRNLPTGEGPGRGDLTRLVHGLVRHE
jgi:hypothetical protein